MKVDGGCFCGHVTYEAEVDPARVAICHCTDCQSHSATAYGVVVPIVDDKFTVLTGALKTYVKTAESGNKRAQVFCPECGTHLYSTSVGEGAKVFRIRTSTARQRDDLPPKRQGWHRSAQPWLADLASLPSREQQ